jgi:signal transduction histidine kinase/ActR/RegA family two-component response regulator
VSEESAVAIDFESALRLSRELHQVTRTEQVIHAAREAIAAAVGYRTAWLALFDETGPEIMVEVFLGSGELIEPVARAPRFPFKGDPMLAEIYSGRAPVVVEDARSDPRTNKELVAFYGNRTIVNVPLIFGDDVLGALGTGTFAPDPPRPPTVAQLENLVLIATQVAPALQRVNLLGTQEAMQRQLHAAQRLESIAVLAGGVAHDFNNLLTVILGTLGIMTASDADERALLDEAMDAARRGAQLTRQLLALARRQPMELAPTDVAARLRSVLGMARRLLPESIAIESEIADGLPPVLADPSQLDQVFLNLLVNARDAMPDGGRLLVRAGAEAAEEAPGRVLRVAVSDDGVGMPPEVLDHVLEPFFTTKPAGQGTGLGLSVAVGIVEQHGGKVRVRSSPGAGTTFDVLLPAFEGEAAQPAREQPPPIRPQGSERILLAEDERAVRAIAERVLAAAGYRVSTAADGREAIDAARRGARFDLIILDAVMPRASGRQAFEEISALQPSARFLVVSGHTAWAFRPDELHALGIPFLEKPYTPEMLLAAVLAALRQPAPAALRASASRG